MFTTIKGTQPDRPQADQPSAINVVIFTIAHAPLLLLPPYLSSNRANGIIFNRRRTADMPNSLIDRYFSENCRRLDALKNRPDPFRSTCSLRNAFATDDKDTRGQSSPAQNGWVNTRRVPRSADTSRTRDSRLSINNAPPGRAGRLAPVIGNGRS